VEKILDIIDSIAHEKGLRQDSVKEALNTAMVKTAKKIYGEDYEYDSEIDSAKKIMRLYQKVVVVSDEEKEADPESENMLTLKEAKELDPDVEVGDELRYELPLDNLGRTAAATLHRELEFHIQRLVEENLFQKYKDKVGTLISSSVVRIDSYENTFSEINEIKAILPKKSRIKGESFKVGNVIKSVIRKVSIDPVYGIVVELSRTSPKFLEVLLELEVPEIKDGLVKIEGCARIPGERAKVALSATDPNIDPVGATVGARGVRIMAVSKEVKNENIDCIEYSPIPEIFLSRALSPAMIKSVKIEEDKAVVTIASDQKSKAIGKSGINIRLASMLTGLQIELLEQGGTLSTPTEASKDQEAPQVAKNDLSALKALFGDN
jgi:N utilization substance protein A